MVFCPCSLPHNFLGDLIKTNGMALGWNYRRLLKQQLLMLLLAVCPDVGVKYAAAACAYTAFYEARY